MDWNTFALWMYLDVIKWIFIYMYIRHRKER